MLGSRLGSILTSLLGSQLGSSQDDEGPSAQVDLLVAIIGQSNSTGQANFAASNGGESSYGISNTIPFSAVTLDAQWANGGATNPIVWSNLNKQGMIAYAPAGSANMGNEQSLGRYLVKYGIAKKPGIIKFGVLGSSLQNHWLPSANFPTIGGKLPDQCITYLNQRAAQFGRPIDIIIWIQGETDATDATSSTNYQSNLTTLMSYIRAGIGNVNCPIIIQGLNTTSSAAFKTTVTNAQIAFVSATSNCFFVPVFDIRLNPDPHYDASGYIGCGDMNAVMIKSIINPSLVTNLGTSGVGLVPYYQQADAGFTCQASGTMIPRSGAESLPNDFELLAVRSGTIATTHALSVAQGFTSTIAPFVSTFSTNVQTLSVWQRPVLNATLLANQSRMPSPSITPGVATLNLSRILGFRNVNTSTPVNTTTTGANNANTTGLSIAGGTTTVNNCLAVIIMCSAGANQKVNTITNAAFSNIQIIWDGTYNPGSGVTHLAVATATIASAGSFGATSVTFANANNNVGAIVVLAPP